MLEARKAQRWPWMQAIIKDLNYTSSQPELDVLSTQEHSSVSGDYSPISPVSRYASLGVLRRTDRTTPHVSHTADCRARLEEPVLL